jgi:hypothetical protein
MKGRPTVNISGAIPTEIERRTCDSTEFKISKEVAGAHPLQVVVS